MKLKKMIKYNLDALKKYNYTLYQQNYPRWNESCSAVGVYPSSAKKAVDLGSGVTKAARWYFALITI